MNWIKLAIKQSPSFLTMSQSEKYGANTGGGIKQLRIKFKGK